MLCLMMGEVSNCFKGTSCLPPQISNITRLLTVTVKALCTCEMLGTAHCPTEQRNITEDSNPQQHCYENLIS
jgi:hypothetical protein